jgi:hypothetical protein
MCCDEAAAQVCAGGRVQLARALTHVEEIRAGGVLVLAASGGPLFRRIRRLMQTLPPAPTPGIALAAMLTLPTVALLLVCNSFAQVQPLQGTAVPLAPGAGSQDGSVAAVSPSAPSGSATEPLNSKLQVLPDPSSTVSTAGAMTDDALSTGLETRAQVFDLGYAEGPERKKADEVQQVLAQIQRLLYGRDKAPNEEPDRRFWYDEESGLLTVMDTPQQLARVANYLQMPWVQAQLRQDSGQTTAVTGILRQGQTMRMGDVALRLEALSFLPEKQSASARLLVRNGKVAYPHELLELSSVHAGRCVISYLETVNSIDNGTTTMAARIEMRVPIEKKISSELPSLANGQNRSTAQRNESVAKIYELYRTFEGLVAAQNYDGAEKVLAQVHILDPDEPTLASKQQRVAQYTGRRTYQVRVAAGMTEHASAVLMEQLKKEGYQPVKRIERNSGYYDVVIGSARSRSEAQSLERDLKNAGFTPEGILAPNSNPDDMPQPTVIESTGR